MGTDEALAQALDVARVFDATVHVVYVVDAQSGQPGSRSGGPEHHLGSTAERVLVRSAVVFLTVS